MIEQRSPLALLSIAAVGLLALALSCATPAPRGGARGTDKKRELVPVGELPPAQRSLLEAYGRGGPEWDAARERALADPALARFLVDNLVLELGRGYRALSGTEPERGRAALDRAQSELALCHEYSLPVLVQMLEMPDAVLAALAHKTLVQIGRPAIDALVPALANGTSRARQRAAAVLAELPPAGANEPEVQARLAALLEHDPEWIVRAESAGALAARGSRDRETAPARGALERALNDPDVAVSESAALALARLQDPRAIPALIRALQRAVNDGNLRLVHASTRALQVLSGSRQELDLAGWIHWWEQHQSEIEAPARASGGTRR